MTKGPFATEKMKEAMRDAEQKLRRILAEKLDITEDRIVVQLAPVGDEEIARVLITVDGRGASKEVKMLANSILHSNTQGLERTLN